MLTLFRRHARASIVKVVLGAIILSFVLFFGFTPLQEQFGPQDEAVAVVDGRPIPKTIYQFFFDQQFERLQRQARESKSPLPDTPRELVSSSTIRQLTSRALFLNEAERTGLSIPDKELADAILNIHRDERGDFDGLKYRRGFLSAYAQYGIDYEELVRNDLEFALLERLFGKYELPVVPTPGEKAAVATSRWSFAVVTLKDEGDARTIAAQFIEKPTAKAWKALAKKTKAEIKEYADISIGTRSQLPGRAWELDDFVAVFSLTEKTPVVRAPIAKGGSLSVVRLVKRELATASSTASTERAASGVSLLNEWMAHASAKATIATNLEAP